MIEFEKIYALTKKNPRNLSIYQMNEILLVLCNAYILIRNKEKFMFYINKYIGLDQFYKLYIPEKKKKCKKKM